MLEVETLDEVPEKYRGDYVEKKEGEKVTYIHRAFVASKENTEKLKGRLADYDTVKAKLQAIEDERAKEAQEREARKLKGLKDANDYEALLKIEQEKSQDLERRSGETVKQYNERIEALKKRIEEKETKLAIKELSELAHDDHKAAFERLVKSQVKFDPETDKYTFFDDDGGATSLDLEGFKAHIKGSKVYAGLIKAESSKGGLGQNSRSGGGASDLSKLPPTERITAARAKAKKS